MPRPMAAGVFGYLGYDTVRLMEDSLGQPPPGGIDIPEAMLLRPTLVTAGASVGRHWVALIGFGGGLVGGLTAMPGAIPTIWCDMRGMPKSDQRGLVQPFIAIMQLFALALLLERHSLSSKVVIDLAISLPALFAGSMLGIVAFRNINEIGFRRTILIVLLFSGASLAFA